MLVAMSNDTLYFDDNMSCRYWTPDILYQNLFLDDWNLFCENLGKLVEDLTEKMINSPLQLEDEIQIFYGDYMWEVGVLRHL